MGQGDFWNDSNSAQEVIQQANELKSWTEPYKEIKERFQNVAEMLPDAEELGDQELIDELLSDLTAVEKEIETLEVRRMLSSDLDRCNCFLSINSGAGGTEACDWALMLSRMYTRWAERRGWSVEVMDSVPGEVAGIKSMMLKLSGPFAFGYAKAEKGVHRLVRISPFDSGNRRHTSFASVDASPEIADDIEVEISPADLRIDTFRASGAGGQHVNVTDSAVRITHLPTGIVVSCQNERSQLQNRETCMKLLRSRLYEKMREEREQEILAMKGEQKSIGWGSQIRSYVFQPYTLVKDARTGYEVGNVQAMMDGELLDEFIVVFLKEFGSGL